MAPQQEPVQSMCQLYLVVDARPDPAFGDRLANTLRRIKPACVLLTAGETARLDAVVCVPLMEIVHESGAVVLIADDVQLARALKADGVHLSWSEDIETRFRDVRQFIMTQFIAGADAGRSRHDAMTLGETGAEYVGFGIPAHVSDRDTAHERQIDLIEWWSETFEVPCVAFDVESFEQARRLSEAGADFVAVRMPSDLDASAHANWLDTLEDMFKTTTTAA
jgi:thiamine-phosphate pyrophosphorylase